MKTEHITNLLDERPLADLQDSERAAIESHIADCAACLQAYRAAELSASLIRQRAAATIEPTPFFKTRVMAAWRERQAEPPFSFAAVWRTARAMVASMIAVVMILVALNFYVSNSRLPATTEPLAANDTFYSTESVILGNSDLSDELTDSEVLNTLYESSGRYGDYK